MILPLALDSVAHTTVYARFAPTVSGNRTDSVTHTSLGAVIRYLHVSGRGVAAQPTVQASSITFSAVTAAGMTPWAGPAAMAPGGSV